VGFRHQVDPQGFIVHSDRGEEVVEALRSTVVLSRGGC